MSNQKSFKTTLIFLGIVALAFLAGYYFVYRDIEKKNEHISSLLQQLDFQSSRQEYLVSTQRMIQSLNTDMEKINNSIISIDGNVAFIEGLENLAKNNGLTISIDSLSIEDNPTFSSSGITTFKIRAKIKGTWAGIYTFLYEIESLPNKVKVNKFSVVNEADSKKTEGEVIYSPNWQASFEIVVLKYK